MSSSLLQSSKSIHVKTINDTSSNKWEKFLKHSGNQELFELNPYSAVSDTSIKHGLNFAGALSQSVFWKPNGEKILNIQEASAF